MPQDAKGTVARGLHSIYPGGCLLQREILSTIAAKHELVFFFPATTMFETSQFWAPNDRSQIATVFVDDRCDTWYKSGWTLGLGDGCDGDLYINEALSAVGVTAPSPPWDQPPVAHPRGAQTMTQKYVKKTNKRHTTNKKKSQGSIYCCSRVSALSDLLGPTRE